MKSYKHYLKTNGGVTILFDDGSTTTIVSANPQYDEVVAALEAHQYSEIPGIVDKAHLVETQTMGKFKLEDGCIVFEGSPMPRALSNVVMQFVDAGENTTPLIRFWRNLRKNPDVVAQEGLYSFISHNHMTITEDGYFIGYKGVKEDFTDGHTGTIDNSVGKTPRMKREDVDADPNQTCSRGLHVASYDYAVNTYGGAHIIECKVNPAHVVAVPNDYNSQKIRVYFYKVLRECMRESENKELVDGHKITTKSESISATGEGRINVPATFLSDMSCNAGDSLYAVARTRKTASIVLTTVKPTDAYFVRKYTVAKNGRMRISADVLNKCGIGDNDEYKIRVRKNIVQIVRA